jgi:hypothetical protein
MFSKFETTKILLYFAALSVVILGCESMSDEKSSMTNAVADVWMTFSFSVEVLDENSGLPVPDSIVQFSYGSAMDPSQESVPIEVGATDTKGRLAVQFTQLVGVPIVLKMNSDGSQIIDSTYEDTRLIFRVQKGGYDQRIIEFNVNARRDFSDEEPYAIPLGTVKMAQKSL